MNDQNKIDIDAMQERVDNKHREHLNKVWDEIITKSDKVDEDNQTVRTLWGKALQQEVDNEENKIIAKMESEKEQAIKKIENKYKRNSTHTQVAQRKEEDEDLKQMLKNISYR